MTMARRRLLRPRGLRRIAWIAAASILLLQLTAATHALADDAHDLRDRCPICLKLDRSGDAPVAAGIAPADIPVVNAPAIADLPTQQDRSIEHQRFPRAPPALRS